MRLLLIISFLFYSILYSQEEKRLALVIGNANYEKGELKNPVNDARLIASSLDSLDFDVILKEDIETQNDFKLAILEFGKKRPNYDVAFVYYAGHGVQISNENYLLPTRQDFTSEDEVELFGVSVQDIMKYLRSQTDQVNILILDACRDNPFESNWNSTRSLKGGGLAKIPPPTGSLIAFSTDSGQTAPDGEGLNSVYTLSLSRNMMLEQTSIDQVFRNVRTEVLAETNGMQRPVEATQLTGKEFYLNPSEYSEIFKKVDDILVDEKEDEIYQGLTLIESVINKTKDKTDKNEALILKARLYGALDEYKNAEEILDLVIKEDSLYSEVYFHYGYLKRDMKQFKKSIEYYSKAIQIEPNDPDLYYYRTTPYEALEMFGKAEADYLKAIELTPDYANYYLDLGNLYKDFDKPEKAIAQYLKILDFEPDNNGALNNLGIIYQKMREFEKAEEFYFKAIEIDSESPQPYFNLGYIYNYQKKYQKSIEYISKAIQLNPDDPDYYYYRTSPYEALEMFGKAEADYLKAIELTPDYANYYLDLGNLYREFDKPEKAIAQYLKILDFEPENTSALNNMGTTYIKTKDFEKAKEVLIKAIEIKPDYLYSHVNLAIIYSELDQEKKSIEYYSKAIQIEPNDPDLYYYRTTPYEALEMFGKAEADYLKAIELTPDYANYYLDLGDLYKNNLNDPEKAKKSYLKAIDTYDKRLEVNKNNSEYYIEIANIYSKYINDFKSGLKWIQKAGKLEKTAWTLESEALIYFNLGDFKNAEKKYLEAIELDPKEPNLLTSISNFYIEQKNYKKAKEFIIKANSLDIYYPDSNYKLAILFIEEGDYINAYEQLSLCIFNMINNTEGYYISDFDNISNVELEDLYVLRSEIAFKLMGKNNKSCEDLNKAFELDSQYELIKEKMNEICN